MHGHGSAIKLTLSVCPAFGFVVLAGAVRCTSNVYPPGRRPPAPLAYLQKSRYIPTYSNTNTVRMHNNDVTLIQRVHESSLQMDFFFINYWSKNFFLWKMSASPKTSKTPKKFFFGRKLYEGNQKVLFYYK